jgi:SAM-dependent methyltransferase
MRRFLARSADAAFDVVVDGNCLHCTAGEIRERCLKEVHRILRPDGTFIIGKHVRLAEADRVAVRYTADRAGARGRGRRDAIAPTLIVRHE